jgi:hypothetical protein
MILLYSFFSRSDPDIQRDLKYRKIGGWGFSSSRKWQMKSDTIAAAERTS